MSQYVEVVPTAGGGRPSGKIHVAPVVGSGSSGGGSIGGSTLRKLDKLGKSGAATAALAQATAPAPKPQPENTPGRRFPTAEGSPASALIKTLTGSAGGGGLGVLLPVILIGSLLSAAGTAVLRRRGPV